MTRNNNISPLPWYDKIEEQSHRKSYAYGEVYPLFTPANMFLPFQIMRATRANEVSEVKIYHKDGTLFRDVTVYAKETGLHVQRYEEFGYDLIIYPANLPMSIAQPDGQYYATISDGVQTWYSDIYTVVQNLDGYVSVEWWDAEDAVFDAGRIAYKYGDKIEDKWGANLVTSDVDGFYTDTDGYTSGVGDFPAYTSKLIKLEAGKTYRIKQTGDVSAGVMVFAEVDQGINEAEPRLVFTGTAGMTTEYKIRSDYRGKTCKTHFTYAGDGALGIAYVWFYNGAIKSDLMIPAVGAGSYSYGDVEVPENADRIMVQISQNVTGYATVAIDGLFLSDAECDSRLKLLDSWQDTERIYTAPTDKNVYLQVYLPPEYGKTLPEVYAVQEYVGENLIEGGERYRNRLYFCTELGRPDYEFSEEGETRDGYFFPEKQVSEKTYHFMILAPEYLCDVMRFIRMSDYKVVRDQFGRVYECDTFLITPKWQNQGYLASVDVEFQTDTVVKKIGRGYIPTTGGDFNSDYNNDYKTK